MREGYVDAYGKISKSLKYEKLTGRHILNGESDKIIVEM